MRCWRIAHAGKPDYLNPDADYLIADVADPVAVARAVRGVDAVCHQAAMVGQGTDLSDAPGYVRHNDVGTAVLLSELAARGFAGRLVLASSMVVYGEGGYRCRTHGAVTPGPRARAELCRGPVRASLSGVRRSARSACGPRDGDARSPQPLRRHQGPPGAPVLVLRARVRGDGHRAALPQRVRAADAERHALRRGGVDLRQLAGAR